MTDWRTALLRRMGAPVTPQNLQFLASWQQKEGGHTNNDARFNWLNTTHGGPGVTGEINSVGVKAFDSFAHGISATAATLNSGRYGDIVGALRQGNPYSANVSAGLQTWVSGSSTGNPGYASRVLGGKAAASQAPARGVPQPTQPSAPMGQAMDPAMWRKQFAAELLSHQAGAPPDFGGLIALAAQRKQLIAAQEHFGPTVARPAPQMSSAQGGDFLARAVGGVKYANLGGPAAHQARALGNWQSDNAWDLGVAKGTPLYAVEDGVIGGRVGVQSTRPKDGSRFTLNGTTNNYWYGHLSKLVVSAGEHVRAGQLVGYSGASANGVPHLHIGTER